MAMKLTRVDGTPKEPEKIPMQPRRPRVLRQDLDELARKVNSAIEGLTNRVMMDRKRNEELIESRTSSSPRSKEFQEWKAAIGESVNRCILTYERLEEGWEKFRAESASNHATRMKVYQDHEERLCLLETRLGNAGFVAPGSAGSNDRIVAGMDISLALHRMHLVRDCAMRWANQPMRSAAEDAIRALGGKIE